jgi:hypothetical protein
MKKILFLSLTILVVNTIGYAGDDAKTAPEKDNKEKTKPATPAPAIKSAPSGDASVIYLGTNEFYLALVREGILKG